MSDVETLLARCKLLGAELSPQPDGKLKVRAPAPLPAELQEELRNRKAEVLAALTQQESPLWPCPHCDRPAVVEEVYPSLDGTKMLTLWHCDPCQTYGVTPNTVREPPVWVPKVKQ